MVDPNSAIEALEQLSYGGIFIITFFSGYIIPVPEEIVLITVGYLSSVGVVHFGRIVFLSILAVFLSDCGLFYLARHHNRYTERLKVRLERSWISKSRLVSRQHIRRTIFLLRFVISFRFVGPILAGSLNTPWLTFLLPDLAAVLIYVPVLTFLGFYFHASFAKLVTGVEASQHLIFILAMIIVGLLITRFAHRKWRRSATPVDTLPS
jgi:membrane protein DedA with SNARE-associated domain